MAEVPGGHAREAAEEPLELLVQGVDHAQQAGGFVDGCRVARAPGGRGDLRVREPLGLEPEDLAVSDPLHQTPLSLVRAVILAARTVVGWLGDGINSLSSGYSSDMKKRLIEAKTRDVKPFCSSLTSINRLYNTPHQIIADKEALYIAPI